MTTPDQDVEDSPRFGAPALEEWTAIVENVMRGVAHALNNRAAAISAVIELSRNATPEDIDATRSILSTELRRVTELAQVIRTLGPPRRAAEAFAPADVVPEIVAILQLHIEHRDRAVEIEATSAPPVRAPRWMFVRACVALGVAALQGDEGRHPLRLVITADGEDWVAVRVLPARLPERMSSAYAEELARAMGGTPLAREPGLRIPTLVSLRRREGR